jgi:hypothetical protein
VKVKAKSLLLIVPLAVSTLTFLTLPANAVCWFWKPCADYQGYGYGGPTESQTVLPPLPARVDRASKIGKARSDCSPGASRRPGEAETGEKA